MAQAVFSSSSPSFLSRAALARFPACVVVLRHRRSLLRWDAAAKISESGRLVASKLCPNGVISREVRSKGQPKDAVSVTVVGFNFLLLEVVEGNVRTERKVQINAY